MSEKRFRIMGGPSLPWDMVAPFEDQARKNHNQSLEELNARGGLDVVEFWCVANSVPLNHGCSKEYALAWIAQKLAEHETRMQVARVSTLEKTIREFQEATMLSDHQDNPHDVTPEHLRQAVQDWGDEIQRLTTETRILGFQKTALEAELAELYAKHERVLDRQEELASQLHQYKTVAIAKDQLPVVVMSLADFTAMHKAKS